MKHTIEELQFANTVRELAIKLRNESITSIADMALREAWKQEHPMYDFIPLAVQELERVAVITKTA